jgi:ABC-2 type transport system permease protein
MRKTLVVALREYNAAVRTKAFLIGLVLMPVLMGGTLLVQVLIKERDVKEKVIVVSDPQFAAALRTALDAHNKRYAVDPSMGEQGGTLRFEEAPDASKGDVVGSLVLGSDVLRPGPSGEKADPGRRLVVYEANRLAGLELRMQIDALVNEAVQAERFRALGVAEPSSRALAQRVPFVVKTNAIFAVPLVLMLLMFLVLMMVANPLMQGVVEEKMQRIAEVLLGSLGPFELMLGKLLGMAAVALTIVSVYLLGAAWGAHHFGFGAYVPGPGLLAWFFLFQTLAALMYGAIFAAIGAACSDMKETQNLLLPVMLVCCVPMFLMTNVIRDPNSPVVTAASFFPFATPMLMIARQSVPPGVPWWQPAIGAAVVLAATLLCVWAAGRIFRVGLLMQGKGATLGEMTRWVFRA